MLHLVTFGGLALESVNEAVAPRLSAQRLAILAVLAAEGDRRVSRERLTGLFWPDADEERARHSLRQALYTLRHEVGREIVRSDFVLSLDASAITSDVAAFRAALARGDRPAAGKLVRGPFLQGFYLPSAAPFQRWAEEERARLHTAATTAIAALATEAAASNDLDTAVAWWRQLTELDPLSGRFAASYLQALAARGDRAEALAFARAHTALVHRELETEPDLEVRNLEAKLRSMTTTVTPNVNPPAPVAAPEHAANEPPPVSIPTPTREPLAARVPWQLRRLAVTGGLLALVAAAVVAARSTGWPSPGRARASMANPSVATLPAGAGTRSLTAYRLFQEGVRAFHGADRPAAQRLMRAALQDDSTFALAAYYDAMATDDGVNFVLEDRALRLAARAPARDRLLITADILRRMQSPAAAAVAESLGASYPNDIAALEVVARTRQDVGDWAGAARALERAIAIDSATRDPGAPCRLCDALVALAEVYYWADSLPAATRVGRRYVRLFPDSPRGWDILTWAAVKAGDTAAAAGALRRSTELFAASRSEPQEVRFKLLLDQYETTIADLRPLLESPKLDDVGGARWWLMIALRNQGRLNEARTYNQTGRLAGVAPPSVSPLAPDPTNEALLALESGDPWTAVAAFTRVRQAMDTQSWPPGFAARNLAWSGTLIGMALAATGDTAAVLRMADSVQYWGERSLFGRDRRAHHYLRGMVQVAAGRDDEAIRELEQGIYSSTLGFTRVNFELGRALLRRGRAREAVSVVQPALRGEIDAGNLYITRTELHELLAQAFDKASEPDSAATHYRAVVRAWANADPPFQARREVARRWLGRYQSQRIRTGD